jgi:S-(hydroxymethyl)glutathione dehydrogenase/alcohol dehydrogenase
MAQAIRIHEHGGPEVLKWEALDVGAPGPGQVRLKHTAVGLNYIDTYQRSGLYKMPLPFIPGSEGAGVVEAVGPGVAHVAPGDPVAFCFVPPCRACGACAAGRFNLCETAMAHAWAGTMLDGTTRLRLADARPVRHFNFVSCFAERAVVPAASAVPIPAALPLWQAALLGCAVVTGFGAVRNAARVAIGESVCVIGCGGIGLQMVAAARMAGAGRIVAVDRDPAKLALALARGATDTVDASAGDPRAAVLALVPGGVDHALEAVGNPATIRLAWDVIRMGATAVVVGIAPRGAEVSLPALELLSEKAVRGSYYGSGNATLEIARLAQLMADGRLEVADAVSHLTDLDGIEEAFGRLRSGSGARTVAVIDAAIAGAPQQSAMASSGAV